MTPRRLASSSTTSRPGRCSSVPPRTSAPTCCCGSDDRADGRELVRRLHRIVNPAGRGRSEPTTTSLTVAFTYHGLKALGVPQASLDSFAPEFREGWRPGPPILGDTGESSPEHWEEPLGTADVHVAIAVLSPDAGAARRPPPRRPARPTHELPGDRADLASGLLPAADRADVVRVQGRDRPARGRGQRPTPDELRGSGPSRPARSSSATPTRRASCRRCRLRTSSAATAPTSSSASCTPRWRPTGSTCAPGPRTAPRRTLLGREDGRALAERRAARARRPTRDDPELGARPAPQQRLRLRRRPARLQVPGRCPRPPRQPARRLRRRRQRRRPPPPDDPARHQLRADAARRRARGRRPRPRHHLRLRRRPPQAAVRVRQDPVAQRRHLHRRPAEKRPARRAERRAPAASPSRSARSAAGSRTCRRSSSPAAASTASRPSLRAMRWLAELDT